MLQAIRGEERPVDGVCQRPLMPCASCLPFYTLSRLRLPSSGTGTTRVLYPTAHNLQLSVSDRACYQALKHLVAAAALSPRLKGFLGPLGVVQASLKMHHHTLVTTMLFIPLWTVSNSTTCQKGTIHKFVSISINGVPDREKP